MCKSKLFLLLIIYIPNSLCIIDDLYNAGKALHQLYLNLDEFRLSNDEKMVTVDALFGAETARSQGLKNKLDNIHEELSRMGESLSSSKIRESFRLWPIAVYVCLDRVQTLAENIGEFYDEFHGYRESISHDSPTQMQTFLRKASVDVMQESLWMRENAIGENKLMPNYRNLLQAISHDGIILHTQLCNGPELIAATIYRLFRTVMIAEIKANIILGFATIYLYSMSPEWKAMNWMALSAFGRQFAAYTKEFSEAIDIAGTLYMRACDPTDSTWIRDKNFYELVGTFQSTIFRYHWGICHYGSCDDIVRIRNRCEAEPYSLRSACPDKITSCSYLGAIKACVLKSGPYKFQYLNSTKLGPLGRNFECPKTNGHLIDDDTGNYVHAACGCNCHSNRNKISLVLIQSHVASNRVITALRFFRQHQILYIQARESRLNAHGYIQRFSERWIPLPKNIPTSHIHSINKTNGVFFLDDLRLPSHHVLTGIKFNKVTRENKTGFAIEIFGVPFNYGTGKLYSESKFLESKQASNRYLGNELSFERVNSIYTTLPHSPSPANFNYVSLRRSKLRDDFGQSTLPLFDGVLVKPNPPTLLGGVGIFHKGTEGYAGFISLRIFPIEYGQFFKDFQSVFMADGKISFNHSNHDQMCASNSTSK